MRKVYDRIIDMRGNLITVVAEGYRLGELARIQKTEWHFLPMLRFSVSMGIMVTLQVFENTRGISTDDQVDFLNRQMQAIFCDALLGQTIEWRWRSRSMTDPRSLENRSISERLPSILCRRIIPSELVRTNIPMIDVFNCLVKSQKIPIFSVAGEPYNALLMRIANQTDADVVIIAGMGLRFDDYQAFIDNAEKVGFY